MFPRRGAIALVTTAMALVLLFNFKTPDQAPLTGGIASTGGSASDARRPRRTARRPGPPRRAGTDRPARRRPHRPARSGSTTGTETLTGNVVPSRYGNTQVQVTITNGKITSVTALQLPTGGRSGRISQYVEPILSSEALTAQSASIDIVSGATYTSEAYAQSLQSALDQAAVTTQPAG